MTRLLAFAAALLCALGCTEPSPTSERSSPAAAAASSATASLNRWLDEEFAAYLDFSPLAKTRLGDKSDYDKLDDVSFAMQDKRLAWRRDSVARMRQSFDRARLDAEGMRSYDLWEYLLEREEKAQLWRHHRYVFGRGGPQTRLPNSLINYHKVGTIEDMKAYIARLDASGAYLRQWLERARDSAARGIRAPYFDYELALRQIANVMTGEPFTPDGTSAIWLDITAKIEALRAGGLATEARAAELTREARRALLQEMKPAYEEVALWLETDRDNVPDVARGASSLPDGAAYYRARLERMTTLPLNANEIHETGLAEVARIHGEMRAIQADVGFEGTLQDFFAHLREDDQFYFPDTDAGREAYLELARSYLAGMQAALPRAFRTLPKGPLEVRRVEAFRERPGGAAHYARGTKDGSRPGVFYAHLADMRAVEKYRLENLAYHEGVPGHHLQIAIQQELEGVPRFRTYHGYTAFSEGWGLYAEYLAKELGFYEDPYSDFGRLVGELWRSIRLVVDTGIHAQGWTEQQAIDYALENSPRPEGTVRAEIRRYFNNPGQATAYKIGMLEILELRRKAELALGDAYDQRAFHDVVLGSGPLPLPFLEEKVNVWIARVEKQRDAA